MWIPTEQDAVDMFSRHFEALHRSGAAAKADQRAAELRRSGDISGHAMWKKVADRIRQVRTPSDIERRRSMEAARF